MLELLSIIALCSSISAIMLGLLVLFEIVRYFKENHDNK